MSQLLEDRIRTSLRATAERVPATSVTVAEPVEQPARLWMRGPAIAVAAMLAVLVVVGGSVLLLTPDGTGDGGVAAGSSFERFPIPSYIPNGVEFVEADYGIADPSNPAVVRAVVARETAVGFADAVLITVVDSPNATGWEGDEPIEVNGRPAMLMRQDGEGVTIWWEQDGNAVWVHAANADADLALAVAEAVIVTDAELFSDETVSFGPLPDAFTVFARPMLEPIGNRPYVMMFGGGEPMSPSPDAVNIATSPLSIEHTVGSSGEGTTTTVRGHRAYRDEYTDGEDTMVSLVWAEADGLTVTVLGNYSEDEIRKIAESIDFVTEAEWRDHYNVDDSALDIPTTTTTVNVAPTAPAGEDAVTPPSGDPSAPTTTVPPSTDS
ncbi:MAG: DUF4367 domain-containing protein [Actinomycetota bacterium]